MTERADRDLAPLYLRLYCDEDVSMGVIDNLRHRGFDVLSALQADRLRLDDDAQLAFAVAERRVLLTHNRHDFEVRHGHYVATNQEHYGVVIAKRRASDAAIVARVLSLLDSVTADEMLNQLRYV